MIFIQRLLIKLIKNHINKFFIFLIEIEKIMEVYYNNQKVSTHSLDPSTTVGGIKKIIKDWLAPQGINNYEIILYFNNGTQLAPIVFQTNQYDNINFVAQSNLLPGSKLYVINTTTNTLNNTGVETINEVGINLDKLPKDVVLLTALNLKYNEIMNLCNTSKKYDSMICKNRDFWIKKLMQDFKVDPNTIVGDPRKYYKDLIKPKYYVLVDTGYERPDAYQDITLQLQTTNQLRRYQGKSTIDLVAINGKSTKPEYNDNNLIEKLFGPSNILLGNYDPVVSNPIFVTTDVKKDTIKTIIQLAKDLEYCEIWGNGREIIEYNLEPGITLVHLKLKDVEAG